MKKYVLFIALVFMCAVTWSQAPVADGTGYREADSTKKAALVSFDSSKRWLVFDTDNQRWEFWDGDSWEALGSSFDPSSNQTITGNWAFNGNFDIGGYNFDYGNNIMTVSGGNIFNILGYDTGGLHYTMLTVDGNGLGFNSTSTSLDQRSYFKTDNVLSQQYVQMPDLSSFVGNTATMATEEWVSAQGFNHTATEDIVLGTYSIKPLDGLNSWGINYNSLNNYWNFDSPNGIAASQLRIGDLSTPTSPYVYFDPTLLTTYRNQKVPDADGTYLLKEQADLLYSTIGSGGINSVSEDLTPQLSGNLLTNGNDINLTAGDKINYDINADGWTYTFTDVTNSIGYGFNQKIYGSSNDHYFVNGDDGTLGNIHGIGDNIQVSTAINGDTGLYDILFTFNGRINSIPNTVNLGSQQITNTTSPITIAHDSNNPNSDVDLNSNTTISVSGTISGDCGIVDIYPTGTQTITFTNSDGGTLEVVASNPTVAYYRHKRKEGVVWYVNEDIFTPPVADATPPTPPTNLVISNITYTTVDLSWTAATDNVAVTNYKVYNSDIFIADIPTATTSATLTGLVPGTTYSITIRALDGAGNESTNSNLQSITTNTTPILNYTPASIDATATVEGDAVTIWNDLSVSDIDAVSAGTTDPTLNISPTPINQVRFNGVDTWMNLGNPTALNFVGGVDDFSIVVKVGEITNTNTGYFISKANTTLNDRQYGLYRDATRIGFVLRGIVYTSPVVIAPDDLIIVTVNATTFDLTVNDTVIYNDEPIITTNGSITTANINVGCRTDGGGAFYDGDIELIQLYNSELTTTEIAYIKSTYQVN